jgi:AraC family transcriptional regulator
MEQQSESRGQALLWHEWMPRSEPVSRIFSAQYLIRFTAPTAARQGLFRSRMNSFPMDAGSIVLPLRGVQEWAQVEQDVDVQVMRIRDDAVQAAAVEMVPASHAEIEPATRLDDARLSGILNAIDAERQMGCPAGNLFMEAMENCVATLLLLGRPTRSFRKARGGLAPFRRRQILEMIESRLGEPLTLAELAEAVSLSQSHFSSMFRTSTGLSPHQYILRRRIARAKRLMRDPMKSMTDVALECGFATPQHFSQVFRVLTGSSPSEYRRGL